MDRKKLVLLLGALIIAMGTAFAARTMLAGGGSPTAEASVQPTSGPRVLVAKRALPAGTIVTLDAVSFQQWPDELLQDAYFLDGVADINALLGTVVRYPITAGEPVTQGALVAPGDRGFLAAALGPGMRAVTVPVSAQTGVAGFIFPGDRVDLVLTQTVEGDDVPLLTAETVLRNVRVLATDQTTEQTKDEQGKTLVKTFTTVTLEVTPKIAEKVAVAQTIGTLNLVLRSIRDNSDEIERALATGDIVIPPGASPELEDKLIKSAMMRPVDKGATYVTGADVSRFQRSTMPSFNNRGGGSNSSSSDAGTASAQPSVRQVTGPTVRVSRGKEVVEVMIDNGSSGAKAGK
ncbi:MAG: Flp pilus assembly protein CpaB [Erythrobacter sp.]